MTTVTPQQLTALSTAIAHQHSVALQYNHDGITVLPGIAIPSAHGRKDCSQRQVVAAEQLLSRVHDGILNTQHVRRPF
jgi:hypothetical protein